VFSFINHAPLLDKKRPAENGHVDDEVYLTDTYKICFAGALLYFMCITVPVWSYVKVSQEHNWLWTVLFVLNIRTKEYNLAPPPQLLLFGILYTLKSEFNNCILL